MGPTWAWLRARPNLNPPPATTGKKTLATPLLARAVEAAHLAGFDARDRCGEFGQPLRGQQPSRPCRHAQALALPAAIHCGDRVEEKALAGDLVADPHTTYGVIAALFPFLRPLARPLAPTVNRSV